MSFALPPMAGRGTDKGAAMGGAIQGGLGVGVAVGPTNLAYPMPGPFGAKIVRGADNQAGTRIPIEHIVIPNEVSNYIQMGDLVFREICADSTESTPATSGDVATKEGVYLTLTALNAMLYEWRDLPKTKSPLIILSRFKVVGVVVGISNMGVAGMVRGGTMAVTVAMSRDVMMNNYLAAIDPKLAKEGAWFMLEPHLFDVADDHTTKTSAALGADKTTSYVSPELITGDLKAALERDRFWPVVPEQKEGRMRTAEQPLAGFLDNKRQVAEILEATKKQQPVSQTYYQLVPVVSLTRETNTAHEAFDAIFTGVEPKPRIKIGQIDRVIPGGSKANANLLFPKGSKTAPDWTSVGKLNIILKMGA
jgi:hypothetical protein